MSPATAAVAGDMAVAAREYQAEAFADRILADVLIGAHNVRFRG
jgi:hypothetical protein